MRIAYGVFGYGRGHTTRALAVLPELERRHRLLIFASGMAYEMLSREREVVEVPALSYRYVAGRMATLPTLFHNAGHVLDVLLGGRALDAVVARMRDFRPDVAICDVDPWTHRAAARLRIPRISFDHYGILAYCRPPVPLGDQFRLARDVAAYRALTRGAQRVVVSSFYDAPVRRRDVTCVGTLLRDAVHAVPATRGGQLLAYFNQPALLTARVEEALASSGAPVVVYGTARRGREGRLEFRAPSERGFLEELARCRAVVGTAGNQLVGEALYFGKPLLVMPEDSVEQRLNAAAVERCGIGRRLDHRRLTAAAVRDFLDEEQRFRDRTRWHARDGRAEAVAALERFAAELAGTPAPAAALAEVA
jgi:uncharacterized protein (TIGR00661 family)